MKVRYIILSDFVNVWNIAIMKILKHIQKFASVLDFFGLSQEQWKLDIT